MSFYGRNGHALPAQNCSRRHPVQFIKIFPDALRPVNQACRQIINRVD
jgi:hypothetical protein